MHVREAVPEDVPDVLNVLDGAALETDHDRVHASVEQGETFVAVRNDGSDGPVLGAIVLDGDHVEAIAVRSNRRGQGIGTTLVETAIERRDRLTAEFDADVRPFYDSLGFAVEPAAGDDRFHGVWTPI